jgi:hypothetical protein
MPQEPILTLPVASVRHWVMSHTTCFFAVSSRLSRVRLPRQIGQIPSRSVGSVSLLSGCLAASGLQIGLQNRQFICDFLRLPHPDGCRSWATAVASRLARQPCDLPGLDTAGGRDAAIAKRLRVSRPSRACLYLLRLDQSRDYLSSVGVPFTSPPSRRRPCLS